MRVNSSSVLPPPSRGLRSRSCAIDETWSGLKLVIRGGGDAIHVAARLKAENVPVILTSTMAAPAFVEAIVLREADAQRALAGAGELEGVE